MPAEANTRALTTSNVVDHMRVEDGLYVLGCFERRVTLLSQQVRALNLVHSLRAEGLLDSGSAVAIIGGGVAGLTAAAGAARLGCKVTLLELGAALLHLIRGNHTRWLHPHLYDWPHDGAEHEEAGLPLVNWRAAIADDVVRQIEASWDTLPERDRIHVHTHAEVTDLGSSSPRRLTWNGKSGFRTETFALVILAVGFGLERPVPGIPRLLYWDDDNLHQTARTATKRILISGAGDGGLIDLLRVRLRDFRHQEVLKTFLGSPALGPIKERLLVIEREAVTQERKREGSSRAHLCDAYMKLEVPDEVDEAIKARLRDDGTTVVLNGRDTLPLTLGASILNRFLVSRLLRSGFGLTYRPGEFGEPKKKGDAFEVQFATGAPVVFDVIIGRHGPNPALEIGFPAIWKQHAAALRARSLLDQTRWPIYGDTFDLAPPASPPPTGGSPPPTAPKRPAGPLLVGVPESLGAGFKGRVQLLKDIHLALQGERRVALHSPSPRPGHVAAYGGGGIGKSRLAAEYAVRHRDDYPGGIFFAVAADRGPLAIWAELARRAPHLFSEDLTQDEVAAVAFARWLGDPSHGARLVVFDDIQAANAAELSARFAKREARGQAIWPIEPGTGVRVLCTTRLRRFPGANEMEVAQLDAQAARELLVAKSERLRLSPEDEAAALELADRVLGGHPLALSLAGSYLRECGPGVSFASYRDDVTRVGAARALEEAKKHVGHEIEDHESSILATYELSRGLLNTTDPVDERAFRVLTVASLLAANMPIDRRLLRRGLKDAGDVANDKQVGLATSRLLRLSLLGPSQEEEGEEGDVVVHPLVADCTRTVLGEGELKRGELAMIETVNGLLPGTPEDFWMVTRPGAHLDWEWLSPYREAHVVEVWRRTGRHATPRRARLGRAIGDLRVVRGNLAGAMEMLQGARSVCEQLARQNPEDIERQRDLTVSHSRIGNVLQEQGQTEDALSNYRAALAIAERLAAQDPGNTQWQCDLAASHHQMGNVLLAQGQTEDALSNYRAALAIAERLAAQDPGNAEWQRALAASHHKIGNVLRVQGQTEDALLAYRVQLAITKWLTAQDPGNIQWQRDLFVGHDNIGDLLLAQGQTENALSDYGTALTITERLTRQGPGNTQWQRDLSVSHNKMGDVLLAQGQTEDTLSAYRAALAIRERLARQDPGNAQWQRDLSVSHIKVGNALLAQGQTENALLAYRAATTIFEWLAAKDPSNAQWRSDLSLIQRQIDKLQGANGQEH